MMRRSRRQRAATSSMRPRVSPHRKEQRVMRVFLPICVVALALATAASSSAERTYPINLRFPMHKVVEFDPGVSIDAPPCLVTTADVTEVFTVEVHVLAAGVDDQDNL